MPNKTLWKFLNEGMTSAQNGEKWEIGKWKKVEGTIKACQNGYHASERILDALNYVKGPVLALVEVRGDNDVEKDKECWREMRIVKAYEWDKEESVRLSVFSARLALPLWKKFDPKDDRVEKAIEAAEAWLKNPCAETESAAEAAARSAWSAESAARSAARSAAEAAARSAAEAAARSAESAARSAWSAAEAAAVMAAAVMAAAARSAAWSAAEAAWSAARSAESAAEAARSAAWSAWSAESDEAYDKALQEALEKIEEYLIGRTENMKKV